MHSEFIQVHPRILGCKLWRAAVRLCHWILKSGTCAVEQSRSRENEVTHVPKNNGVGRCRGGTLDVGLFILDYKSAIFSGVRRVQDFCFSCFVNGH